MIENSQVSVDISTMNKNRSNGFKFLEVKLEKKAQKKKEKDMKLKL